MLEIIRSPCRMTWQVVYKLAGKQTVIKACRAKKEAEALLESLRKTFEGVVK